VRGVRDDQVADRLVRLSGACLLHKPNPDHFSGCFLNFGVSTHDSSLIRGIAKYVCKIHWRSFKVEKSHQHREFGDAIPDPSEDFDFAIPSLDGEPSHRPVR
jgi:hypothetical protein